jgi:hypothetical protein
MSRHRIPKAQFVDNLTGEVTIVRPPYIKTLGRKEVHYNPVVHGGKALAVANRQAKKDDTEGALNGRARYQLLCGGCDLSKGPGVEIHYNVGAKHRIGGMAKSIRGHFRTNARETPQVHLHCAFNTVSGNSSSEKRDYSNATGYRLHLNIPGVDDHFNAPNLVHSDEVHRLVYHDMDIANLEPVSIRSAADIVAFLESCPPEKLRNTFVIHKGYDPIPWHEFCIRRDRKSGPEPVASPRFIHLTETLMDSGGRAAMPVFLEVSLIRPVKAQGGADSARGISRSMFWGKTEEDVRMGRNLIKSEKSHHIQPRLIMRNMDDPAMGSVIPEAGSYFVLGHARLITENKGECANHYLDIEVTRPDQIIQRDVEGIAYTPKAGKQGRQVSVAAVGMHP